MNIDNNDIIQIVHDKLLGLTSTEQDAILQEWLKDKRHHLLFEQLQSRKNLVERYHPYEQSDADAAFMQFKEKHFTKNSAWRSSHIWKYAAAIVILVCCSALYLFRGNTRQELPPVALSPTVEKAIATSQKAGRQEAELTLVGRDNSKVQVSSIADYQKILAETPADVVYNLSTKADKEFWITLDDGTRVHLNNNSHLKYPAAFGSDSRVVYLEGEAYFKVAKEPNRPFVVTTANGTVKEYGTEFTVNTRSQHGKTEVVLIAGKISVTPNQGIEKMMRPGERAIMNNQSSEFSDIDLQPYKAWNEGEFMFQDTRMDVLMDVLAHWYGLEVIYQNPHARSILFTGTLDRYGHVSTMLKAIGVVTGLDVKLVGNQVIIK